MSRRGCLQRLDTSCFFGVKDLPWIRGIHYMGQVTLLGQVKWKTIPEFTALNQGTKDFVIWIYPLWGTKYHLKKCVLHGTTCHVQEGPLFLVIPSTDWSCLFPLALDSGKACDCFDQWNMVEVMLWWLQMWSLWGQMHSTLFLESSELPHRKSVYPAGDTTWRGCEIQWSRTGALLSAVLQAALSRQQACECKLSQTLQSSLESGWARVWP